MLYHIVHRIRLVARHTYIPVGSKKSLCFIFISEEVSIWEFWVLLIPRVHNIKESVLLQFGLSKMLM